MRCWCFLLSVVLTAWGVQTSSRQVDLHADLVKARAKWQAEKPQSYAFTIELGCLCTGILRPAPTFRVVNGQSSPAVELDARSRRTYEAYNTIEKLFAAIDRSLAYGQYKNTVQYDETLGFPVLANLDPQQFIVDDELYFRVADFRRIEAK
jgi:hypothetical protein